MRLLHFDQIDSTNAEAMRLAHAGERGPLWIVADRQTRGRGRSGRAWASEPGNLYASLLFEPGCPPARLHQLSLLAGVAAIDALRAVAGGTQAALDGAHRLRLKWPNDVLLGSAKLAGILPESLLRGAAEPARAVIGIGINLAWAPTGIGRATTHLAAHGSIVDSARMLDALAANLADALALWRAGDGFGLIRAAWLERAGPIGEAISVNTGADPATAPIAGTFAGLDTDGALLMRDAESRILRYTYGDVALTAPGND